MSSRNVVSSVALTHFRQLYHDGKLAYIEDAGLKRIGILTQRINLSLRGAPATYIMSACAWVQL